MISWQKNKTDCEQKHINEHLVMATLWLQTSAEYRAICYQTFKLAKTNLDNFLKTYNSPKPLAVIVDVDETVIDNSAYDAFLVGKDFGHSSKIWNRWMDAKQAKAIPGALDFLLYAKNKGVEIFYVTNRKMIGYEQTKNNLNALGFPFLDQKHLLLKKNDKDKTGRRNQVAKEYEIAFLIGDNLNDFSAIFADKSIKERFQEVDQHRDSWGTRFIVMPNPMYGEWEGTIYNYNWRSSMNKKDKMRKALLNKWDGK